MFCGESLRQKSPAVVGSGMRWAPKRVEVGLVLATVLEVIEARPAGEEVEGDVEDVVRLVVGQVKLQERDRLVDRPAEVQDPGELGEHAEATSGDGLLALAKLVGHRRGQDHRRSAAAVGRIDAFAGAAFAGVALSA